MAIRAVEKKKGSASGGNVQTQRAAVFIQFFNFLQTEGNVPKIRILLPVFSFFQGNGFDLIRCIAHFRLEFTGAERLRRDGVKKQPYVKCLNVVLTEIFQLNGNRCGEFPLQEPLISTAAPEFGYCYEVW